MKIEKRSFEKGTKVTTLAVNFGPEREYSYLCETEGTQFWVDLTLLEDFR